MFKHGFVSFLKLRLAVVAAFAVALSSAALAQEPVKLKLAEVVRSQFFVPMYVALGKSFAKDEGLDVEVTTVNGGDKVGALLLSGGTDIALTGPEVPLYIYNSESKEKPAIFSALTGTDGFFFVSRKKLDNFDWSQVQGKILGFRQGTTPEMFLEHVLAKHGVSPQVIKNDIITNIAINARDGAWLSGSGDFGIFQEPNLSRLEKEGELFVLRSIGKEVGRADYTVFWAKKSWLTANVATTQKWTNAIARAQAWMKTASSAEIAKVVAPYFPGSTPDDTIALVDRYRNAGAPIWADTPLVEKAGLAMMQSIMVEAGTLPADKIVKYEDIVDTSFAEKAVRAAASGK